MNPGFWRGKKVFLTGHTGFKGSWLGLWLESAGARVTGFALDPATKPSLFELAKLGKRIDSKIGDIRDLATLEAVYRKAEPDVTIHMAAQALVRPSYRDPVGTFATNLMGTVNLLDCARRFPSARSIVVVTTDKCYENIECKTHAYRETNRLGGLDPYSNSKACAELAAGSMRNSFFRERGAAGVASARAGNVVGGGDWSEDRLIPDCIRALEAGRAIPVRNPDSTRPWQHVLEPLSGYLLLAERLFEKPAEFSEPFNFGPADPLQAKPVSWIATELVRQWGSGARWESASNPDTLHEAGFLMLDSSHAREKLGWKPKLSLEKTIEWVVEWYRGVLVEKRDAAELTLSQIQRY